MGAAEIAVVLYGFFDMARLSELWQSDSARSSAGVPQEEGTENISVMRGSVLANCAQLGVTIGYYFYNSLLTSMLVAAEYGSHGVDRKPLRVTWPVKDSLQRSTYWLSVPYRYWIPITILFIVIH